MLPRLMACSVLKDDFRSDVGPRRFKLFIYPEVKKLVPIQSSAVVEAVFSGLQGRYRDSVDSGCNLDRRKAEESFPWVPVDIRNAPKD
jgi:hypothetical protein